MAELDKIKDEPWQRVTHAYYEHWCILMALYFEIHQLPWLKGKWKKAKEDYPTQNPLHYEYVS